MKSDLRSLEWRYGRWLRARGMRMTPRRQQICTSLERQLAVDGFVTAESLFASLRPPPNGEHGRATVYRTLSELEQSGILAFEDNRYRLV